MKRIGLVTTEQYLPYQLEIIKGVREITQNGYELVIDSLGEDLTTRKPFSLDVSSLDGLMVLDNILPDDHIQALHEGGLPITLVGHFIDNASIPTVIQNNVDGMTQLMDYIIDTCQRSNLVFVQGDMTQHDGIRRHQLFQWGLMKHALSPEDAIYLATDSDPVKAASAMLDILDANQTFDGVVAADYIMGCAVLDILRFYDVLVPDDVSVVAFGDGVEAIDFGLTVAGINVIDLGRRAARQLLGQIEGVRFSGVTWLNTELIVRDSS